MSCLLVDDGRYERVGVDKREIERMRARLDKYVADVFASLKRKDQRDKGGLYLRGLILKGASEVDAANG